MKSLKFAFLIVLLTVTLSACATEPEPASPATEATGEPAAPAAAEPATPAAPANAPAVAERPAPPPAPRLTQIPAGTSINVILIDSISTGTNKAGDQFAASLAEPIVINGNTIVAKGTRVQGRIVDAEGSGRVSGRANIRMVLTSITDGQKNYPIVTKPFVAEAEGTRGRDAAIIGGAAGIGAAIGAIAGGGSGAAKGAAIGSGAGAGTVLATKGNEVEFSSESRLQFTLDQSAELPRIAGRIS